MNPHIHVRECKVAPESHNLIAGRVNYQSWLAVVIVSNFDAMPNQSRHATPIGRVSWFGGVLFFHTSVTHGHLEFS
jgi:hypothetical protein